MSFQCTIVTPEAEVLDESVSGAVLPAHDGQVGILTGRAPLLVKLGVGELSLDTPGGAKRFFVDGGVAQMKGQTLTVLTNNAVPPEKIDRALLGGTQGCAEVALEARPPRRPAAPRCSERNRRSIA